MPEKGTIKLRIPGSKKEIEVPRWAAYALGGSALIALIFMRDKEPSRGDGNGRLAAELAQSLEEQRRLFGTAIGQLEERIEQIRAPVPSTPDPGRPPQKKPKKPKIPKLEFIPGYGQQEIGEFEFVDVSDLSGDVDLPETSERIEGPITRTRVGPLSFDPQRRLRPTPKPMIPTSPPTLTPKPKPSPPPRIVGRFLPPPRAEISPKPVGRSEAVKRARASAAKAAAARVSAAAAARAAVVKRAQAVKREEKSKLGRR